MVIDKRVTADRIYRLMVSAGMSNADLAEKLGVSAMAVWKWLNAKSLPTLENIAAMCGIFNVEIGEIVAMKLAKAA